MMLVWHRWICLFNEIWSAQEDFQADLIREKQQLFVNEMLSSKHLLQALGYS